MAVELSPVYRVRFKGLKKFRKEVREQLQEVLTRMATSEELNQRLVAATSNIAGDLQRVKDQVAQAIADKDQAVQDAVNSALAPLDASISQLESLAAENPEPETPPVDENPGVPENPPVDENPGPGEDGTNPPAEPEPAPESPVVEQP